MSAVPQQPGLDVAAIRARDAENVIVDKEIIRHRLSSRVIHWSVAVTFFVCLVSGLPIWTPVFGWMATLFGGLAVCRWLHAWAGLAFTLASLAMLLHWNSEMVMTARERSWIGPNLLRYLRDEANHAEIGKYNGGQKVFFYTSGLSALALLVSGVVMWFPLSFPQAIRVLSYLLHDFTFALFAISIVFHIYLATVAEPGTFNAMMRGTVSKAWARIHHPRWYSDLMKS
jgi:formate dehydrogenase subunit gamma